MEYYGELGLHENWTAQERVENLRISAPLQISCIKSIIRKLQNCLMRTIALREFDQPEYHHDRVQRAITTKVWKDIRYALTNVRLVSLEFHHAFEIADVQ